MTVFQEHTANRRRSSTCVVKSSMYIEKDSKTTDLEDFPIVEEPHDRSHPHYPNEPPPAYIEEPIASLRRRLTQKVIKTRRFTPHICAGITLVLFIILALAVAIPLARRQQAPPPESISISISSVPTMAITTTTAPISSPAINSASKTIATNKPTCDPSKHDCPDRNLESGTGQMMGIKPKETSNPS